MSINRRDTDTLHPQTEIKIPQTEIKIPHKVAKTIMTLDDFDALVLQEMEARGLQGASYRYPEHLIHLVPPLSGGQDHTSVVRATESSVGNLALPGVVAASAICRAGDSASVGQSPSAGLPEPRRTFLRKVATFAGAAAGLALMGKLSERKAAAYGCNCSSYPYCCTQLVESTWCAYCTPGCPMYSEFCSSGSGSSYYGKFRVYATAYAGAPPCGLYCSSYYAYDCC